MFQVLGTVASGRVPTQRGLMLTASCSKMLKISKDLADALGLVKGDYLTVVNGEENGKPLYAIRKSVDPQEDRAKLTTITKEEDSGLQVSHSMAWANLQGTTKTNVDWTGELTEVGGDTYFILRNYTVKPKVEREVKAKGEANDTAQAPVDFSAE